MNGGTGPVVQMVYWVDTTILPAGDPEAQRPVVVLAVPPTSMGTVAVVSRSTTDAFGVEHKADIRLGLATPGRFSRRHPVQYELWTPATASLAGRLDDTTFAAVVAGFGRWA